MENPINDVDGRGHVDVRDLTYGLLAEIDLGVAITDARLAGHPVVYCNETFLLLLDLDREEVQGQPHPFLSPNAMDGEARLLLTSTLKAGKSLSTRLQYRRQDHIIAWIALDLHAIPKGEESATHYFWLVRDIGQNVAHEELWKRYESIVSTSGEFMALIRDDYTHELVNDAMCLAHNESSGALIGKTGSEIWGDEFFERKIEPHLLQCFSGEIIRVRDWVELPKAGRRYLETVYYPYPRDSEKVTHVVYVSRDITDEKNSEDALRALNLELEERVDERTRELERANQDLSAFNSSVAHDLRSPLKLMRAFAQSIIESHGASLPKETQQHLGFLRDGVVQMDHLIEDLLRFSRIGGQPFARQLVNQRELVSHVLAEQLQSHPDRRVETSISELPSVMADEAMLRQVYVNLVSNALKFTETKDVAHIEIGCIEAENELVFFVQDDGIGFDQWQADTVFGVFKRLDTERKYEGSGVGLAIVRRIVEGHGGRVWAEAERGKGAKFCFTLGSESAHE